MILADKDPILASLSDKFKERFGRPATFLGRAPGRLEILGNHTDYNEGTVLSVAINRSARVAAAANPDAQDGMACQLYDIKGKSARRFRLDALDRKRPRDWSNYIKGIVCEFNARGYSIPAFDMIVTGDVPLSAGMSSSAALEMAVVKVLDALSDSKLGWLEQAKIGQGSENHYVGANTGLMDQLSSLMGREGQLIYSDFRSFEVKNVPIPTGTSFVVANSNVKHNLTNEYNERREACEEAARIIGVKALRDVTPAMLEKAKSRLSDVVYRRAKHVVGEIDRVEKGSQALAAGDIKAFGELMSISHDSSRYNFENSCDELDTLVEIGRTLPGFIGARLSGGGFGGITVHLVEADAAQKYSDVLAERYLAKTGVNAQVMILTAGDGAELIRA
ncbi:MAG: galactokinase [Lentisphaeria bacterium]|nr:galactokinase [Lentisphaeria bacterium]